MQEYDESFFRAKANKRAGITWLALIFIATIYYGIKTKNGEIARGYFIAFTVVGSQIDITSVRQIIAIMMQIKDLPSSLMLLSMLTFIVTLGLSAFFFIEITSLLLLAPYRSLPNPQITKRLL